MLATQSLPRGFDHPFRAGADTIKRDVTQVLGSGQYYVTPQLNTELQHIDNGLAHMKLDSDLLKSSPEWANKLNPAGVRNEKHEAAMVMGKASTVMSDLKNHMNHRNVQNMKDNQVREIHHWAMQNLQGVEQEMSPYTQQSLNRIKQFCDHIGVTDRYNGYRNNLNRGNRDPQKLGYKWLEGNPRNACNVPLNVGWNPHTSALPAPPIGQRISDMKMTFGAPPNYTVTRSPPLQAVPPRTLIADARKSAPVSLSRPAVQNAMSQEKGIPLTARRSIQEQCGINTVFPGSPEYQIRFKGEQTNVHPGDYHINPTPNFALTGRPLDRGEFHRNGTEYQSRYEWPDGSTIVKLPWLRK